MTEIEPFQFYRATVNLRCGEGWRVKPGAEKWNGRRVLLMAGGLIDPEDLPAYASEHFMDLCEPREAFDVASEDELDPVWLASGDLVDLEHVEFHVGLAARKVARDMSIERERKVRC